MELPEGVFFLIVKVAYAIVMSGRLYFTYQPGMDYFFWLVTAFMEALVIVGGTAFLLISAAVAEAVYQGKDLI